VCVCVCVQIIFIAREIGIDLFDRIQRRVGDNEAEPALQRASHCSFCITLNLLPSPLQILCCPKGHVSWERCLVWQLKFTFHSINYCHLHYTLVT